jgi:Methyltransferase FkbM domain
MAELGHAHIDLLKMDIEGAEYAVIDDLVDSNIRPAQILVEFHHRMPGIGPERTRHAVLQLRRAGFGLFAVSPSGEEYSFIRVDQGGV